MSNVFSPIGTSPGAGVAAAQAEVNEVVPPAPAWGYRWQAMKRLIMCTAGHVDHGKTTLVRALTGIDCDTHPEEKRRGITINPGFAYLDLLPAQEPGTAPAEPMRIGIVDVPGHHRFIRNMLAGACGVDFALLVVAADDGVMPQTREHLALLGLLGIKDGLVCLNKTDLATPELLDLAYQDVQQALVGSCLEHAAIVPVSARTGHGLAETRAAIAAVVARIAERPCDGPFRMYMDRVFSVAGSGTVVTGSIVGGQVRPNDLLFVLPAAPAGTEVRARRIERHGEEVAMARAGERASINIPGFDPASFERGMLLADRQLATTLRIDGELTVVGERSKFRRHTQTLFYTGTYEAACRVHLLDCDQARAGQKALVQIELDRPAVFLPGDRFILRNASKDATLGGGRCIDASPLHHKRRNHAIIEQVRLRVSGGLDAAIAAEVHKRVSFVSATEIAAAIGCTTDAVRLAASGLTGDVLRLAVDSDGTGAAELFFLGPVASQRMGKAARNCVAQYHRDDPLGTRGLMPLQLASKLALASSRQAESLLETLTGRGVLRKTAGGGYVLPTFETKDTRRLFEAATFALGLLQSAGMSVLSLAKIAHFLRPRFKLEDKDVKTVLRHLVEQGEVSPVDDGYVATAVVVHCRQRLLHYLAQHEGGITVAGFRDLVDGNRRVCLALLTLYDREAVTRRQGDVRFVTDKGRALISQEHA